MALEAASAILELGGDVICFDRASSPLPEPWTKVQRTAEKHDGKVWYYTCDITDEQSTRTLIETAASSARYPLRGLVACAGISGGGPTVDFPISEVKRIFDINLVGTFICAQSVAKEMIKHNVTGSIVLIASMSAHGSNKVTPLKSLISPPFEELMRSSRASTHPPIMPRNPPSSNSPAPSPPNGAVELDTPPSESILLVLGTSRHV